MFSKSIYLAGFLVLILMIGTSYGDTINVLPNPGFEFGTNPWSGFVCSITASSTIKRSGNYSGKAYGRTAAWNGLQQDMSGIMQDGKTYNLSCWIKLEGSGISGDRIYAVIRQKDSRDNNDHYFIIDDTFGYDSTWTPLSGQFTLNIVGTLQSLYLYFAGPNPAVNIYLDDVNLMGEISGGWKEQANARIEQIRKRDAHITVVNPSWYPIRDVNVQIHQKKHRFAFGTCISSTQMSNDSYKNFIADHFEWTACENETKWIWNEWSQDIENYEDADNIYDWCSANGIKVRAPCLFWEYEGYVQDWVKALDYKPWPGDCNLLKQCDERIVNAITHFKDKFKQWDVDNEILPGCSECQFYDRLELNPTDINSRVWMFQRANQTDPNCKLFLNEYNGNSFGSWTSPSIEYVNLVNNLRSKGAPIHGIGVQGHLGYKPDFNPTTYWTNVLKTLGTLGLPIWVTEFDVSESDDARRAAITDDFYRICFSDPNVEGILMWGFLQGTTWQSDWWIVNSDWTLNQTGQKYEALMNEWTTNDANTTNRAGDVNFRGFHGIYEITLTVAGAAPEVRTIELEPGQTPAEFILTMDNLIEPTDCNQVQAFGYVLSSDLNGDCYVNLADFAILADYWLHTDCAVCDGCNGSDFEPDGNVDFDDLSDFCSMWLLCNDPQNPGQCI